MSFEANLGRMLSRHDELTHLMSAGTAKGEAYVRMSREYAELGPVVIAIQAWRQLAREIADLEAMIADNATDKEVRSLAEDELHELKDRLPELEQNMKLMMVPKDEADARNVILEVRAGTGGDEAALFAAALFRMYERYAHARRWKFEILSIQETGIGGYKEAIASIEGNGVYARLKFESGVHRVQRVPVTESGGRIHTSAATVAVMPEAEEVDVEIADKDLRIDTYRSQGAGGQHVNTTDSAVRVTHLPSGIVVTQQDEKSQHKNRAKALKVLRARLFDMERERQAAERSQQRKDQVGSGDRSERIRTYNFPERRVTDHRIGLTVHMLDRFLEGEIDDVVDALIAEDNALRLAGME